ncbi:MAG: flavin reductase family protein [Chloroflexi bacterium]|nr:flavin reductase family protein [Chloroflexota bacterium]
MSDTLNAALQRMSYGMYVVTVAVDGGATAFTASWVSQVSFEPPQVVLSVARERFVNRILRKGKKFAVNIIGQEQARLAAEYAGSGADDRLAEATLLEPQTTGAPVLADALAYLDCQVQEVWETGDHTLFLGQVVSGQVLREGHPLSTDNSNLRYRAG